MSLLYALIKNATVYTIIYCFEIMYCCKVADCAPSITITIIFNPFCQHELCQAVNTET